MICKTFTMEGRKRRKRGVEVNKLRQNNVLMIANKQIHKFINKYRSRLPPTRSTVEWAVVFLCVLISFFFRAPILFNTTLILVMRNSVSLYFS